MLNVKYKGYTIKKDFKGDIVVMDRAGGKFPRDFCDVKSAKKFIDSLGERSCCFEIEWLDNKVNLTGNVDYFPKDDPEIYNYCFE